jgi:hypothetical protein
MTLKELKHNVLVLIEEFDSYATEEGTEKHIWTSDDDIASKLNSVINQVMFECCRFKKIAKYVEIPVKKGDVLAFADFEKKSGYEVYQVGLISGVSYTPRADNTLFRIDEDGTAEVDLFVYPERITEKTSDSYEFELSADILECIPYGAAADILMADESNNFGKIFRERFETMLQRLDSRYAMPTVTFAGGI